MQHFEADREKLRVETENLEGQRRQFTSVQANLCDEAATLKADFEKREADLAARRLEIESREGKLSGEQDAFEDERKSHEQSLLEAHNQIESEKQQLRTAFESVQTERRDLLEEKLRWKPETAPDAEFEQAPPPAPEQKHKRRKRHKAKPPQTPQPPQAAPDNVDLGEQLFRLQAERQQLQAMRAQFAEELQRMRAGRIDTGSAAGPRPATSSPQPDAPRVLRFLLDPGRAESGVIAEVLSEVITLGRLSGIHIARLAASDCRTCRLTRSRKSAARSSSDVVRTLVELQLTAASDSGDEGHAESQSLLWDQFDSSLRMIIPVEAGLARMFPLGDAAAADHEFRKIGREAVDRAGKEAAQRAAHHPISQPGTLPVDLITRQIQKIEGLLRRLSAEFNVTLELAPAGDGNHAALDRAAGRTRFFSRKRLWLGGLVSAAAAGLAAGFHWWPAISQMLGIGAE